MNFVGECSQTDQLLGDVEVVWKIRVLSELHQRDAVDTLSDNDATQSHPHASGHPKPPTGSHWP